MVRYALKVAYRLQELGRGGAVTVADPVLIQLEKVCPEDVLVMVCALFPLADGSGLLIRKSVQQAEALGEALRRQVGHIAHHGTAELQRDGGCGQESLVQLDGLDVTLLVLHQVGGQLVQQVRRGQHDGRAQQIKSGVADGDAHGAGGIVKYRGTERGGNKAVDTHQEARPDDVERQVYHDGAFGLLVGAYG